MEAEGEDPQHFDVESYGNCYTGHGKLARLYFIARNTADASLRMEALRLCADEVKMEKDTALYKEITEAIDGRLGPQYCVDFEWLEQTQRAAQVQQEALETQLAQHKTNLIKESIRLGHCDLGNHHYACGQLQEAFKCFVRSRDYCSTGRHHWQACLNAIRVSIELGQFNNVSTYVTKAEQQPDIKNQPDVIARLTAAAGLSALEGKRYKHAAKKFTEVSAELGSQWNNVIAPQDIALYGGLCALAYLDRRELQEQVIDNVQFREYLETYPEVREIVSDFYGSKYASCLQHLERLKPVLHLDIYMSHHAKELLEAVRSKAVVQYTAPFVSVHLPTMAAAFNVDDRTLANEIAGLIQGGQIQARIDSDSKVLYKRTANARAAIFAAALQASEEYLVETRALLVRASLQRHDLIQKAGPNPRRHKGGNERDGFSPFGGGATSLWVGSHEDGYGGFSIG